MNFNKIESKFGINKLPEPKKNKGSNEAKPSAFVNISQKIASKKSVEKSKKRYNNVYDAIRETNVDEDIENVFSESENIDFELGKKQKLGNIINKY